MSSSELGPLLHRYEVSPRDQRSLAAVRLASSAVALVAAIAVLWSRPPLPVWLIGLLGVLIPIVWIRQARIALRRANAAVPPSLCIHERGFAVSDGPARQAVQWDEVTDVRVDEERLDVVVDRGASGLLRVEPRYQGVEIHTLMRTLRNAWLRARDSSPDG